MQRPMTDTRPYGLNKWLQFLKSQKLPVKSENLASLQKHVAHPDATIENLQTKIKNDPIIAFALLNQANKVIPNKRGEIINPYHAGSMLGMNGITKSLANLSAYQHSKQNPAHSALLREIQTSYEAASVANRWAAEKNTGNEDVFWLTFFRNAPRWLMWFFAYPTMAQLEAKLLAGESAAQAEKSLLGCRIDEITVHMCKYWHSPRAIIESFLTNHIPTSEEFKTLARLSHVPDELPGHTEDKRLTILINSPLIFVYCANKLIQEASLRGWQSNTLHFYYRIIATVTHNYLGKAIQNAHLGSAEAATEFLHNAKIPLACQLLSPTLYCSEETVRKQVVSPKTPNKSIEQLKSQLTKTPLTLKEKLNLTLKTIKLSVPNAEGALLLISKGERVSPFLQYGHPVSNIKKVNWATPSALITKLTKQRSAIHCQGEKLSNLLLDLPYNADSLINRKGHLILISTPVSDTETCIFWLTATQEFSNKDYVTLKKIVMLLSANPRTTF